MMVVGMLDSVHAHMALRVNIRDVRGVRQLPAPRPGPVGVQRI